MKFQGGSMRILSVLLAFLVCSTSFASASRILDGQQITNGANTLTLPTATDTLVGKATTDTFTNKTVDGGSNTFTNISLTTAVTGILPQANGGTGSSSFSGAAGNILGALTGFSTNGNVLTTNGSTASWTTPLTTPSVVGSTGTPTLITAGGGVTFSGTNYRNFNFIAGSGGAVTVTANPQITAGTNVGQILTLIGESASNTVTLSDGTGLSLNGKWVGGLQSVLQLLWDGSVWTEMARR